MASNTSTRSPLAKLTQMRVRGQRPALPVVVGLDGGERAWADRNGMFFVSASECQEVAAFAGLFVLIRTRSPHAVRALAQRIALTASMVTLFDLRGGETEYLLA